MEILYAHDVLINVPFVNLGGNYSDIGKGNRHGTIFEMTAQKKLLKMKNSFLQYY